MNTYLQYLIFFAAILIGIILGCFVVKFVKTNERLALILIIMFLVYCLISSLLFNYVDNYRFWQRSILICEISMLTIIGVLPNKK